MVTGIPTEGFARDLAKHLSQGMPEAIKVVVEEVEELSESGI